MEVQFEKNGASKIANKTLDIGQAKVDLPSWCEMQEGPCDTSKTVMIQVNAQYTTIMIQIINAILKINVYYNYHARETKYKVEQTCFNLSFRCINVFYCQQYIIQCFNTFDLNKHLIMLKTLFGPPYIFTNT